MKTYRLIFLRKATREWNKLGATVRQQFAKKLAGRLEHPKVVADQLRHDPGCYRLKLGKAGYRLIYRVDDEQVVVLVVRIGKREGDEVYVGLSERLADET